MAHQSGPLLGRGVPGAVCVGGAGCASFAGTSMYATLHICTSLVQAQLHQQAVSVTICSLIALVCIMRPAARQSGRSPGQRGVGIGV